MIAFMLIAGPRSGTTWAANWLTTDTTLCLHDPLYQHHYTELDNYRSGKTVGVACTGLYNFPEWVNAHPAPKVVLRRPQREITASLRDIGLPSIDVSGLNRIKGLHVSWGDLFDNPKAIYETLLGKPFDAERHALLRGIHMQPEFETVTINKAVTRRLIDEVRAS
jgi:hypothetical protein